jgi:MoaA/NifB/PqqE/SkfB family radical SAM enzyme
MSKSTYPQHKNLYRLPWSTNDNPIGWLEITDSCNIKCEGCYRLILGDGHKPLQQVKEEILFLKKWRNCNGISISGGEPVLHPDIMDIIRFVKENRMKSIMLTNGYALTDELIGELRKAGLTGLSFHIDKTQQRPELENRKIEKESELNELRLHYAKMVCKAGLYAHFGITVRKDNLHEVPDFIQWAIDHMKMVSGISLIVFRTMPISGDVEWYAKHNRVEVKYDTLGYAVEGGEKNNAVTSKDVYAMIRERIPDYDATAFLGGTEDHTALKWLIGNIIVDSKGKTFGSYGKRTIEMAQTIHHLFTGSYLAYPKKKLGKKILLMGLVDKKVRRALGKYLGYCLAFPPRFFYKVNAFGIGIIQAPDMMPDGRIDMCDDCPDMCVFEGRLVNSCRLDECRKFGTLLHIHYEEKEGATVKSVKQQAEPQKITE